MALKKTLSVLAVVALAFAVLASCSQPAKTDTAAFKVAMATDIGGLGDKSFNDGAKAGLDQAAAELGATIKVVESKQQTDYEPNLTGLATDGNNLIFAVGFLMADDLTKAATANPNTKFAGIDIGVDDKAPANLVGIQFKEQESGYLAGVLAGSLVKAKIDTIPQLKGTNTIGVVLGMDIPPVEHYQAGFYAGAKSVNPDVKMLSIVTGVFNDPSKGKAAALELIGKGAEVVFQVAGQTGLGVIQAAKEKGVLAIGVDVDQYDVLKATADKAGEQFVYGDTIITSAVKGVAKGTFLVAKSVKDGTFKGSSSVFLGLAEDAAGISPYHDFDAKIPQAIKDAVTAAAADIKAGKVTVPATRKDAGYNG